jgi:hypothetical protein
MVSGDTGATSRSHSTSSVTESSPGGDMNLSSNDDYTEERRLRAAEVRSDAEWLRQREPNSERDASRSRSSNDDYHEEPLPFTLQRYHEFRQERRRERSGAARGSNEEYIEEDEFAGNESLEARGTSINGQAGATTTDESSRTSTGTPSFDQFWEDDTLNPIAEHGRYVEVTVKHNLMHHRVWASDAISLSDFIELVVATTDMEVDNKTMDARRLLAFPPRLVFPHLTVGGKRLERDAQLSSYLTARGPVPPVKTHGRQRDNIGWRSHLELDELMLRRHNEERDAGTLYQPYHIMTQPRVQPGHVVLPEGERAVHGLQFVAAASVSTRGSGVRVHNHPPSRGPRGLEYVWPIRRQFVEEVLGGLYDGYVEGRPAALVDFLHYIPTGHIV